MKKKKLTSSQKRMQERTKLAQRLRTIKGLLKIARENKQPQNKLIKEKNSIKARLEELRKIDD